MESKSSACLIGKQAEEYAATYLETVGHSILFRNWRCRLGELDIVSQEDQQIVITEVKVRRKGSPFSIYNSVNRAKQVQLYRVGQAFCTLHRELTKNRSVRFDVIRISYDPSSHDSICSIQHIKRAIDHASASPEYQKKTVPWKTRRRSRRSFHALS